MSPPEEDQGHGSSKDEPDVIVEACKKSRTFRERYDTERIEVLGGGADARVRVLKVFAKPWDDFVAAKVFYQLPEEQKARARREANVARKINSDKVIRNHGPHETAHLFWIETEYIDGPNLAEWLRTATGRRERDDTSLPGKLVPSTTALTLAMTLAEAVRDAHAVGVIHRDIKPQNILLPKNGRPPVKLGDFGLSKSGDATQLSHTGGDPGTPLYRPPETYRGEPFTQLGDIYSLGLVLYQLFTGNHFPYGIPEGATEAHLFAIHTSTTPTPASHFNPTLPPALLDLLTLALSRNPKQRPTAGEILTVLRDLALNLPAPAELAGERLVAGAAKTPVKPSMSGPLAPKPQMLVAGTLAAALLSLGIWIQTARSPNRPNPAPGPPAVGTPSPRLPAAGTSSLSAPAAGTPSPRLPAAGTSSLSAPAAGTPPPSAMGPAAKKTAEGGPQLFRASFDGDELSIINAGPDALSHLQVVVIDARGSRYSAAQLGSAVDAGEEVPFARDQFTPALPRDLRPRAVQILADSPAGRRVATVAVDQR